VVWNQHFFATHNKLQIGFVLICTGVVLGGADQPLERECNVIFFQYKRCWKDIIVL